MNKLIAHNNVSRFHRTLIIGILSVIILLVPMGNSACTPVITSPEQPEPPPVTSQIENNAPVIQNIVGELYIFPSSSSSIHCVASDPDGDDVFYSWSCNGGTLKGQDAHMVWSAPKDLGEYVISVVVTDGKGGEAKGSISVTVELGTNQPPSITLIATPKGEPSVTITTTDKPLRLRQGDNVYIECIAEDPDGDQIFLEWSTTGGRIKGEGEKILYIAGLRGEHEVIVTATDSEGRQVTGKVRFKVECCSG